MPLQTVRFTAALLKKQQILSFTMLFGI